MIPDNPLIPQPHDLYHPSLEPFIDEFYSLAADFDFPGIDGDKIINFLNAVYDVGRNG